MKVILISGTPGTGKTVISNKISKILNAKSISLSRFAIKKGLILSFDSKRDTHVIDEEKLVLEITNLIKKHENQGISHLIIEGHLTDIIPEKNIDIVIQNINVTYFHDFRNDGHIILFCSCADPLRTGFSHSLE